MIASVGSNMEPRVAEGLHLETGPRGTSVAIALRGDVGGVDECRSRSASSSRTEGRELQCERWAGIAAPDHRGVDESSQPLCAAPGRLAGKTDRSSSGS